MAEVQKQLQGEVQLLNKTFREFKGVNTRSDRTAIPEDTFYDLENLMPIGSANLQTVPDKSAALVDYAADLIYWFDYVNIGLTDYMILFSSNGKVFAYNIGSNTNTQIATGLSGSGSLLAQYKNAAVLIIDSTGLYSWNGAAWAGPLAGTGVPGSGTEIAVYAGRVWIVQGRTIAFCGADDGSATPWITLSASSAWTPANGAGFVQMTDPTIKGNITRLWVQNGYLYVYSASSINIISDVYVPTGATPPVPVFSNLNINANIGTDQPGSVFPYGRAIAFATPYGAYQMYGVADEKISDDIDGTWQFWDSAQAISGGMCRVNNILCAAFLFKQLTGPIIGARTVLGMYFNKKWWFANYGALTFVRSGLRSNIPTLFGLIGNKLYRLFDTVSAGVTTSSPATRYMTPLWAMDDALSKKRVIRVGMQTTTSLPSGTSAFYVDTTNSSTLVTGSSNIASVSWVNGSGTTIVWQNNVLATVIWYGGTSLLYSGSAPGAFDNFVGITYTTTASVYEVDAVYMDYKLGPRWG